MGRLSKQVRGLKSITRVHLPSLAVGALVGFGLVKLFGLLKGRKSHPTTLPEEPEAKEEETVDDEAEDKEPETA